LGLECSTVGVLLFVAVQTGFVCQSREDGFFGPVTVVALNLQVGASERVVCTAVVEVTDLPAPIRMAGRTVGRLEAAFVPVFVTGVTIFGGEPGPGTGGVFPVTLCAGHLAVLPFEGVVSELVVEPHHSEAGLFNAVTFGAIARLKLPLVHVVVAAGTGLGWQVDEGSPPPLAMAARAGRLAMCAL
jgi:hypothetical protein